MSSLSARAFHKAAPQNTHTHSLAKGDRLQVKPLNNQYIHPAQTSRCLLRKVKVTFRRVAQGGTALAWES